MLDAHFQPQPSSFGINEEQVAQAISRGELSLTEILSHFLQNEANQLPDNILSGVGKTTFLRKFAKLMAVQHVTGGNLIAAAKNAFMDGRDDLRYANLDENQRLLIEGFALASHANADVV